MTTKKVTKPQWVLPPASSKTLATAPFESFDSIMTHDKNCKCDRRTVNFIGKTMRELGFVYLDCPFDKTHDVFVPAGLDSKDDKQRVVALESYSSFLNTLEATGMTKNANEAHACIHEYLDHGLAGKIYFHPNFRELPYTLLSKKEQKAVINAMADEAVRKAKEAIKTLPKNAFVTTLSDRPEVKDGVQGWVIIRNGVVGGDVKTKPDKYLEGLMFYGFMFGDHAWELLVVKTEDNVRYYRFGEDGLEEVDFETGKKEASQLVKYRGKPLADIPMNKLPKNRVMFSIAMLEKNDVLAA